MAEPYVAELRIFSFGFAPKGWALCDGQLLSIQQNQALFSLLGTFYGGNGVQTFALPNLQGRVALHFGNGFTLGEVTGETSHTLQTAEMATHSHALQGTTATGSVASPAGALLATTSDNLYTDTPGSTVQLATASVTSQGGGGPHENRQPFLVLNVCIALAGIFPQRN